MTGEIWSSVCCFSFFFLSFFFSIFVKTLAENSIKSSCQINRIRSYLGTENVFTEIKCYFCTISLKTTVKIPFACTQFLSRVENATEVLEK